MSSPRSTDDTKAEAAMKDLATPSSRRNALLCALCVGACILIAYPVAAVPFGDDFSYTKTALDFAQTGQFVYNGWATAMLGWQVVWGALFIKLFGFSFTVVRFSTLPISMASIYLLHQIQVRFGIGPRDAVLGSLAFGLSPLFFMIATTYLTDVPGVFVVLVCLYMCQRATLARTERLALIWLISAAAVNVIGGTVRQTSWLGALVMVPSTALLLRKDRRLLTPVAIAALVSGAAILACMHWASRQHFFVREIVIVYPRDVFFLSVAGEYLKAALCLLLVVSPVAFGWLPAPASLNRNQWRALCGVVLALAVAFVLHVRHASLSKWSAPWLISFLQVQGRAIPPWVWAIFSVLIPVMGLAIAAHIRARAVSVLRDRLSGSPYWRAATWLLVPFSLAYGLALLPRAETTVIQDRYLLVVMPGTIILLLVAYERWVGPHLPPVSFVIVFLFGVYTIAATHDFYADLRAGDKATQEILADGVPRTAIAEGFAPDLWAQLQADGYVNSWNMVSASTYYNPHVPLWPFPPQCVDSAQRVFEPAIQPRYFIGYTLSQCFTPTQYKPVSYRTWLPPFHATRLVERIVLTNTAGPR